MYIGDMTITLDSELVLRYLEQKQPAIMSFLDMLQSVGYQFTESGTEILKLYQNLDVNGHDTDITIQSYCFISSDHLHRLQISKNTERVLLSMSEIKEKLKQFEFINVTIHYECRKNYEKLLFPAKLMHSLLPCISNVFDNFILGYEMQPEYDEYGIMLPVHCISQRYHSKTEISSFDVYEEMNTTSNII